MFCKMITWIVLLLVSLAHGVKVQLSISGTDISSGFVNVLNGTGSVVVDNMNASHVGKCQVGYFLNGTECVRCTCSARTVYAGGWVQVNLLR